MRVYLIRHGQGPNNIINKSRLASGGRFNLIQRVLAWLPVTPRGAAEARRTATTLRAMSGGRIDRLYTSPYGRARATARIIGRRLGVKPDAIGDLREIGPGLLDSDQPQLPLALPYRQFRKSLRRVETIGPECRDLLSSARKPLPSGQGIVSYRTGVLHSSGMARASACS